MNRIAPLEGSPVHFDALLYLNGLSTQWKLREMGEPHALTPDMLAEWNGYRGNIADCRCHWFNRSHIALNAKTLLSEVSHEKVIHFVDELIANLEKEYEWPKPSNPIVSAGDIEHLRQCINELDQCRELLIRY